MRPFLLIQTRPEDEAADSEYEQFLRYGDLGEDQLVRLRLDAVDMPEIDLEDWSGFIVGGSPFTGSIPFQHKSDTQLRVESEMSRLLDLVTAADFPFLGACYGVGTLARHQGGVIDFEYAEPIGAPRIRVTAQGAADPLLEGLPPEFHAFVGHKEACSVLPENAVLLATAEACPVQMFRIGQNMYGTQFHPELDFEGLAERIEIYRDAGYFAPEESDSLKAAARLVDVEAVHGVIANFVVRYIRPKLRVTLH